MEVENIAKAATFKSFLHLSYKKTEELFFVTVLFNIFIKQTADDFWGLPKNMNSAFPVKRQAHLKNVLFVTIGIF